MAGPADYLRVTGPLGGANFLSAAEYNTGQRMASQNVTGILNNMQQGVNLQQSRFNLEQDKSKAAAEQAAAQQQSQLGQELQTIQAAKYEARLSQAPAAVEQAPAVQAQQPMQQAPVEQPTLQSFPVAPQLSQAAPAQQAAIIQANAPSGAAGLNVSATPTQEVVQQPAVQQETADAAPVAPAAQAQPQRAAAVQAFRSQPQVAGVPNRTAYENTAKDFELVKQLVDSGKIRPATAEAYLTQVEAAREKSAERAIELRGKIAEIEQKETTTRQKRVEVAAEIRKVEDNEANDIYTALQKGGPEAARVIAEEKGLAFDPNDAKQVATIEARAKRSEDYKEQRKAERESQKDVADVEEAERKRLGVGTGRDVPPGVREVVEGGQVVYRDADGNKLSGAQVQAMALQKARAGATQVSGGGRATSMPASAEPGAISAIKRDKYGNVSVDPTVVKQLKPLTTAANNADQTLKLLDDIEKSGMVDAASASGVGSLISKGQRAVGLNTERRRADEALQRFANSALGIIESPLMKGTPSEADARRALSVINDPESTVETKRAALAALRTALNEAKAIYQDAISQYDEPTRQRLKGLGLDVDVNSQQRASAGQPAQGGLTIGQVVDGFAYLGGDPNKQSNWKKTSK